MNQKPKKTDMSDIEQERTEFGGWRFMVPIGEDRRVLVTLQEQRREVVDGLSHWRLVDCSEEEHVPPEAVFTALMEEEAVNAKGGQVG